MPGCRKQVRIKLNSYLQTRWVGRAIRAADFVHKRARQGACLLTDCLVHSRSPAKNGEMPKNDNVWLYIVLRYSAFSASYQTQTFSPSPSEKSFQGKFDRLVTQNRLEQKADI
jgi:hypothetical protein